MTDQLQQIARSAEDAAIRALNDDTWTPTHTVRVLERCAGALRSAAHQVPFGLVLQPGDRVILALRDADIEREDAERYEAQLVERHPDVAFTIVAGVVGLAVVPGVQLAEEREHPAPTFHDCHGDLDPASPPQGG